MTTNRESRYEISDLIVGDQVVVAQVAAILRSAGQHQAARIVERLPRNGDLLDAEAVAATLRRVHAELQRLGEELQLPRRVAADLLRLRTEGCRIRRVVDLGCGAGHVVRQIARTAALPNVDIVGVDLNADLLDLAEALRAADGIDCTFVHGDALDPSLGLLDADTVVISSGLLHHLRGPELDRMLRTIASQEVAAFLHYDPRPGPLAVLGAVIFHQARMREPISRHDGPMSVRRAHPAATLLATAQRCCPSYEVSCVDAPNPLEVLRPLVGVRRAARSVVR